MTAGAQAQVAARVPGAAALGLLPPPSARLLPATVLTDPDWTAERLAGLGVRYAVDDRAVDDRAVGDRRVLATVWWYSASSVLLTPALAGLATGLPLSARLADTSLAVLAGGTPVAAVSSASGGDLAGQLRETLSTVVGAVAAAGEVRPRPLWAIAADSLANRLLAIGRALGEVPRVTALAGPLAVAVGAPLPVPRYVDVAGVRFTRRVSCCLLYRLPPEPLCTSCPRRPPAERRVLLEDTAERMR
ncbi:(2Fe-2S)-binding protein [Geodermatophilus sp. TF02-6]|uniref:(2Fe-2S)-binding protein n=1 Tax=Geodermatophilus sp. TF02-6 TaxID=2250575 RepID=UPI001F19757A|nr:(2Fe-2S)-binding protein [Geodermatophilus sp. TF02-6]